jgi:predicted amidohydrolase YtcJ
MQIDEEEIPDTKVLATYIDGRILYKSEDME